MRELLLATRNRDKVEEICAILSDLPFLILTPDDFPDLPEVEEDGETLEENASKKALVLAECSGLLSLADDTGLIVPALDGAPGVHSSRYAGEDVTYEENRNKLILEMKDIPDGSRGAYFACVAAVAEPEGIVGVAEGRCEGIILREARGEGGFGYDPIFLYEPEGKTFGELPAEEKNRISHRAIAMQEIRRTLQKYC